MKIKICPNCKISFNLKYNKQVFCSRSCSKSGEFNSQWKGPHYGYGAIHGWVKRRIQKPKCCQNCKKEGPVDLANISQEYKRDVADWEWLCRKCHMTKDGRIERTKSTRFKKGAKTRLGKVASKETVEKIRERVKILWQNPEYRQHMSDVHKKITT